MENWLNSYSNIINTKSFDLNIEKGVLLGFNVNIDRIIEIDPTIICETITSEVLNQLEFFEKSSTYIENEVGFFSCLFDSIKYGKADEILTTSQELINWIENTFDIKETKMGGQAGIIANLYSNLGLEKVLLSIPVLNKELSDLLNPNILTILKTRSHYSIETISSLDSFAQTPINHYVFEFKPGTYLIGEHRIECIRANRFIVSYDEVNSRLEFNEGFSDYCNEFLSDYSLAIISGFHLINSQLNSFKSFGKILAPIKSMLIKWKKISPKLCIHLELASTKDVKLRRTIIRDLFPLVDSVGLNEQELISFIEVLDKSLADNMKESMGSVPVFTALHKILNEFPNLRLHFHYLGYFLVISSPIKEQEIEVRKNSLLLSSLLASMKAEGKIITSLQEISDVTLNLSSKGLEELRTLQDYLETVYSKKMDFSKSGSYELPSFTLVGVPTIVVEKPKTTVGLGDLISSFSILFEVQG